jgi:hypothetical protein
MNDVRGTFVVVALVCVLATGAAGCGGGSSTTTSTASQPKPSRPTRPKTYSRYELAMQVLGDKLAAELANAGRAVGLPTAKRTAIEQILRATQTQLRAAAASLAKIDPPARIKAQHRRLTQAVREFADELNGVIAGIKAGTGAPAYVLIPNLKGLKDMQRASDAITKAGYTIVTQSG